MHLEEGLPVLEDWPPAVVLQLGGWLLGCRAWPFGLHRLGGAFIGQGQAGLWALPIIGVGCLAALGSGLNFKNHDCYLGELFVQDPQYLLLEFFRLSLRTASLKLVMLLIRARRALNVTIDTHCLVDVGVFEGEIFTNMQAIFTKYNSTSNFLCKAVNANCGTSK